MSEQELFDRRDLTVLWPAKGEPVLYQRGKWWVVRWYDPVEKRVHTMRTHSEAFAVKVHELMKELP